MDAMSEHNIGLMDDILKRYPIDNIKDRNGNSLVAIAAINGDANMIKLLLGRGLDPSSQNFDGDTPLHYAISNSSQKCITELLNGNANEKIVNYDGKTPWEITMDRH